MDYNHSDPWSQLHLLQTIDQRSNFQRITIELGGEGPRNIGTLGCDAWEFVKIAPTLWPTTSTSPSPTARYKPWMWNTTYKFNVTTGHNWATHFQWTLIRAGHLADGSWSKNLVTTLVIYHLCALCSTKCLFKLFLDQIGLDETFYQVIPLHIFCKGKSIKLGSHLDIPVCISPVC
jgi:hypothetical protein